MKAELSDREDKSKSERSGIVGGLEDFVQSTVYSAVQRPIDGVVQLADHLGANWKAPSLIPATTDNDLETTLGSMTGNVVDLMLLSKATSAGLTEVGLEGANAWVPYLAGKGIYSGMMGLEMTAIQPVPEGYDYWAAKEKGLGQNVTSFIVMNGITSPLEKTLGDGIFATVFSSTAAGAAGGLANVGIGDLVDHKKPTVDQLKTVATWAELGAAMGAVKVATPYVSSAATGLYKGLFSSVDGDATQADGTSIDKFESKLTDDDGTDDAKDAPSGGGGGGKNIWNRILRMALRKALMPKPAEGPHLGNVKAGRPGSPEAVASEHPVPERASEPAKLEPGKSANASDTSRTEPKPFAGSAEKVKKEKSVLPSLELIDNK